MKTKIKRGETMERKIAARVLQLWVQHQHNPRAVNFSSGTNPMAEEKKKKKRINSLN